MAARQHGKRHATRQYRARTTLAAAAAVAIVVGGTAAVIAFHGSPRPAAGHTSGPPSGTHAHGGSGDGTHPAPAVPLLVEGTSPAGGSQDVPYAPRVTVQLSAPLAAGSPLPVLTPSLAGSWSTAAADTLVFEPAAEYPPYTTVHLTIPGGTQGLRDAGGETLASTVSTSFTVESGSELRLQQLLAELGYLPLAFVRDASSATTTSAGLDAAQLSGGSTSSSSDSQSGLPSSEPAIDGEATSPDLVQLTPEAGHFEWRYADTPPLLTALWTPGLENLITRGAVMAFEDDSGITVDGEAGPAVWQTLLAAVAARKLDPAPYDYISVSEKAPETLYVWQEGETILSVYANTGITEDPTAQGTYPVYARYLVTTMSGKNPNGTKYKDPGIPHVAYFNGGDAIHGFIRSGYGYPQSLGCVELTYTDAANVWPYDQLGTLVTVY